MPPRKTKAKTKTETAAKRKRGQQPDTQAEEEAAVPDRLPAPAVAEKEQADRLATSASYPASSGHSTDSDADEEQQQEQDSVPRAKPRWKGKKVLPITQLPELKDKAEEIIEWWMSYPQLYDKTKLAYHDVVKKKDIITTKAVELGVSYDTLKRGMTHYRDEYYKIMNKVEQAERSGAGLDDVHLTEREQWIYSHLGWLKVHHQPQKNRTVVGLGPDPHTQRQVREAEEEEGDTQESAPQGDPQPDDEPGEGAVRPPSAAGYATSAASAATHGHKKAPAPAVLTQSRVNLAVATQVRTATHEMQDRIAGLVNRMATRDATPDH